MNAQLKVIYLILNSCTDSTPALTVCSMKGIWINIFLFFFVSFCHAQNEVFSRQYFLNNFLVNPAVAGVNDYMDLRLSYSRQWANIDNGPQSVLLTFNTNLARQKDQVLHYSDWDRRYKVIPRSVSDGPRRIKHGIGAKVIYDKINIFSYTDAALTYACHVPLNSWLTLSVGLSGGLSYTTMNIGDNYAGDLSDPVYTADARHEIIPMFGAGFWLYTTGPFLGASLDRYLKNPYDEDDSNYMNVYATVGWQLPLGEETMLVPSALYRMNGYSEASVDVNARLIWKDMVWAGASLRHLEDWSAHLGVLLGNRIELNYTYDINKKEFGASHEIGIAYRIWQKMDACRNKWFFK